MAAARSFLAILAVALAVSACGVRGPLEPPPGARADARTGTSNLEAPDGTVERVIEGPRVRRDRRPLPSRPGRSFILDPLL